MFLRRPRSAVFVVIFVSLVFCLVVATSLTYRNSFPNSPDVRPIHPLVSNLQPPTLGYVSCYSPRGVLLENSVDDQINPISLDGEYPEPLGGSHEVVGLEETWLSAAARYGPYGYREEEQDYNRTRVNWARIDWGKLQNQCLLANGHRFPDASGFTRSPRFALRTWTQRWFGWDLTYRPQHSARRTGRTAVVLRAWETYQYNPEDLWNLRSIISEAGLATGGDYAVYLLVNIKDKSLHIHKDPTAYEVALRRTVPPELQSIAILFDGNLLESWYPGVLEHRPEYQIMQPLQLFAHFYRDFDHYWQFEMDSRFTGHVGHYLDALSLFAKAQPRKQARERASYTYMSRVHGTYSKFSAAVNASLTGSGLWGPLLIPDISPIGPTPPTPNAQDDPFIWGVGESADLIVLKCCATVSRMKDWVYRDWAYGFSSASSSIPRTSCPPAQGRASWNLLNAIHTAQAVSALRVPSEATLPSFALWHGLKMVLAPQPYYQDPPQDPWVMDEFWNGGPVGSQADGMAYGLGMYDWRGHADLSTNMTWVWSSSFPTKIMDAWLGDRPNGDLPYLLRRHGGHIYAPNLALHPRKTNRNPM